MERSRGTVSLSTLTTFKLHRKLPCFARDMKDGIQCACRAPLEEHGIITARVQGLIPAVATYAKNICTMYCPPSGIYLLR